MVQMVQAAHVCVHALNQMHYSYMYTTLHSILLIFLARHSAIEVWRHAVDCGTPPHVGAWVLMPSVQASSLGAVRTFWTHARTHVRLAMQPIHLASVRGHERAALYMLPIHRTCQVRHHGGSCTRVPRHRPDNMVGMWASSGWHWSSPY